ncbi:sulfotransferase family 2 domain-containing protein [Ekhidna sp.]|uniref:sulfotransferase family 2 domain-containing protein n=1 Tax=Ekhidna sp. TaxID=2608089 RepID=UPI003CCBC89E
MTPFHINSRFVTKLLPEVIKTYLGQSVYERVYDKKKLIFIHTPKTAGTSISSVLYGTDPWHYSASELKMINKKKFLSYPKVGFVRNPFSRLLSTYHYAFQWIKQNPKTSVAFVTNYSDFEAFINRGLTSEIVKNHYFFWSYTRYLSENGKMCMDKIGRFENLKRDFKDIFGEEMHLPELNRSKSSLNYKDFYDANMIVKVKDLYKDDLISFNYDF